MALAGRKPKPAGQAVTRHKLTHEFVDVPNVRFAGGPDLPQKRQDGSAWPARTRAKWESWRSMPHAVLWGAEEWDWALDCIEVAAKWHSTGDLKAAVELRNRERTLGTTLEFRRSIRVRYVDVQPESAVSEVSNIDDYRAI